MVNVKDYGAVGDGVTDDTVAINAAVAAAFATSASAGMGGATVYLPPGDYAVSSTVYVRPVTVVTGTAQAGSSTTITLASGASSTNDAYSFAKITITGGAGSGQSRIIISYVGSTKIATVGQTWTTNPNNTSVYSIDTFSTSLRSVSMVGHPLGSRVKALSGFSGDAVVSVDSLAASGDRYGQLVGLTIDANNIASVALHVGLSVERHYESLNIVNGTVASLRVDGAQNNVFESLHVGSAPRALMVLNGAGNNLFNRVEHAGATVNACYLGLDTSLPSYYRNFFGTGSPPAQNLWVKCVMEQGAAETMIPLYIASGTYNHFNDVIFSTTYNSTTPAASVVTVGDSGSSNCFNNQFNGCTFNRSNDPSSQLYVLVNSNGFQTVFSDCTWAPGVSGSDALQLYNAAMIDRADMPSSFQVQNMAGSATDNVQVFSGSRVSGTTSQRSMYRSTIPRGVRPPYYNTTLARWEVFDGTTWLGLTSNTQTLTYGTNVVVDASLGRHYIVTISNGVAFNINTPSNPTAGQEISFEIRNSSGGAHGAITFISTAYATQGAVTIPNGGIATVTFYYNGSKWIETTRSFNTVRVLNVTSNNTPSINTDAYDQVNILAQAGAITSMSTNLTGTPADGQELVIRVKDNGSARAITWGSSFQASGTVSLLTTTSPSKTHLTRFRYDSIAGKWVAIFTDATGY